VACKAGGLRADNFYSAQLAGQVGYHVFEGISTSVEERPRLVASLGDKPILLLRNHGLLVAAPHVPQALELYWRLQRACEVQVAADAMDGPNQPIDPAVLAAIPEQRARGQAALLANGRRPGQAFFDALVRRAGIRLEDLAGD
jgi:ribulose-5-phosphate 4-epimerase/fuculose-1-phosphate aldolase